MIPHEILKKIRQIEIRTNRIVTETFAGVLSTKAGVLDREMRQSSGIVVLFRSCISPGSRFTLLAANN